MQELMFNDGNLEFTTDSGIRGFENKLVNSILIFGIETFYNNNAGMNFDVISSNQTEYKLEHIKNKLLEWYSEELESLEYKDIRIIGKVVKATLEYSHKTLGKNTKEVVI
ncbi:MAG: hypothetical protein RSB50_06360 [Cetobacterium sp.]